MSEGPTHDELKQTIKALEKELSLLKETDQRLQDSEKMYRQIFENSSIGLGIADQQGNIIKYNDAMLKPGKYSRDDISNINNIAELYYNQDDRDRVLDIANEKGFVHGAHVKFKKKDGSPYTASFSLHPIRIRDEFYWQAMVQDISERLHTQKELNKSKQLFERTLFSLQDAIFIIEADSIVIQDCSPSVHDIFGYTVQECIGRTTNFLHVNDKALKEFRQHLNSAIKKQGFLSLFEFRMKRKDGSLFPTEHFVTPITGKNLDRIGWVSVVRDITERKKFEAELISEKTKLQTALEEIKTLKGILPLCAYCKKIRNDKGDWERVEAYINRHTGADISHGICPECMEKHYPGLE